MRDLDAIGLTEEIRGEAIMPRDPEPVPCPECGGDCTVPVGWGRGKRTETCPKCQGLGAVEVDQL